jgi:peptide/nickel transport system substrate-binding protein
MDREPLALYVFRFVMGLGLFAFMAMLYWSSVMLEHDVKALRSEVMQLRSDMFNWSGAIERVRGDILQALAQGHSTAAIGQAAIERALPSDNNSLAAMSDERYPNLLQTDLFYQNVLPKLLGNKFKPQGVLHTSTIVKPESLHPFNGNADVISWNQMCRGAVGQNKFGIYDSLAPDLATKMEERKDDATGVSEYWIFLRRDIYWQPLEPRFFEGVELAPLFLRKHPVTAHDFKLYYDAIMNPYMQEMGAVALRSYIGNIDTVRVVDDHTFVVRWKTQPVEQPDGTVRNLVQYNAKLMTAALQPLPGFVCKHFTDGSKILEEDSAEDSYRTSSVWAQNYAQHWSKNTIISCGPWVFDGMTDQQIRMRRNTEYYNPLAVLVEASETSFRSSSDALWQDFQALKTDTYILSPEKLSEWETFKKSAVYAQQQERNLGIERLDYVARSYSYVAWNQNKPYYRYLLPLFLC